MTIPAFLFALAVLVAVHEYGHYRMAVACGVKVLRFSIGFGPVLWRWRRGQGETEFVLCALPLGGYVRMLDQREGDVPAQELHRAFDTQRLRVRSAIVAAGPLANLVLAVALFAAVAWLGIEEPQPVLSHPAAGTLAAEAGLHSGDRVLRAGPRGEPAQEVQSFDELRWLLTQGVLDGAVMKLEVLSQGERHSRTVELDLAPLQGAEVDAQMFLRMGIAAPFRAPVVVQVQQGGAADRAGLLNGDVVLRVDGQRIADSAQLIERVRGAAKDGQASVQTWSIDRGGRELDIVVRPALRQDGATSVGRVDALVGGDYATALVHRGLLGGVRHGLKRTWDMGVVSLQMIGRMLVGRASIKNISGPLSIADYAGKSASHGLSYYLVFLGVISVSLGILNLLPVPVLDGGHLMYYLWEGVTGKALSEAWLNRLQRGGVAVLVLLMSVALYNDATRFFG